MVFLQGKNFGGGVVGFFLEMMESQRNEGLNQWVTWVP